VWKDSGSAGDGYTNWSKAAHEIQDAVDEAWWGDHVWVTNGEYSTGGALTPGANGLTSRVMIAKAILLQSVNGATNTSIKGSADPSTTNGPAAVRCLYMTNGSSVVGFTLKDGHTGTSGHLEYDRGGGGAFLAGGGTLVDCVIESCTATWEGGGAHCRMGEIRNCYIQDSHSAYRAGGVFLTGGALLSGSTIRRNSSVNEGGGVRSEGKDTIEYCTVKDNSAGLNGGGVDCSGGGTEVRNCVIAGNTSGIDGGGVGNWRGTLRNCTISSNTAARWGGGVYSADGTNLNCIIYGNTTATTQALDWRNTGSSLFEFCDTAPTNGLPGGTGCIEVDPLFAAPLAGDYHIWNFSPCVDVGNNDYVSGSVDFDGYSRIQSISVDMGAYEVGEDRFVATNGGHNYPFTTWQDAATNIQDAVDAAPPGVIVHVDDGVYNTGRHMAPDGMGWCRVVVTNPLVLNAPDGPATTIIAGNADPDQPFWLVGSNATRCVYLAPGAQLWGFSLTNGYTDSVGAAIQGGAVYGGAQVTLSNCVVRGSRSYGAGGGVYCGPGSTVQRTVVQRNNTEIADGGGIYCSGALTLQNSVVGRNYAWVESDPAHGGGVYAGVVEINNCTISSNTAIASGDVSGGGGLYCATGTVQNSILYHNVADVGADQLGDAAFAYSCLGSTNTEAGYNPTYTECFTNDPQFVDKSAGDFHLRWDSPCINTGKNDYVVSGLDADGNPRIVWEIVDLGAYEKQPDIHYVSTNGAGISPYLSWNDAATNIQDAVDVASVDDTVLVTNGVYARGGAAAPGHLLTNRVCVTRAVHVRSTGDREDTLIVGRADPVSTNNGPGAIRCVYLTGAAVLSGFTLTNGHTYVSGVDDGDGGGLFLEQSGTLSNCVVVGNYCHDVGAGAYVTTVTTGGDIVGCVLANNTAGWWYGGAFVAGGRLLDSVVENNTPSGDGCVFWGEIDACIIRGNYGRGADCSDDGRISNCLIVSNRTESSVGGVYNAGGTVVNCTISDNEAALSPGGVETIDGGTNSHCIIRFNRVGSAEDNWSSSGSAYEYCFTTPTNGLSPTCSSNDPGFATAPVGTYRLGYGSPCIDAGQDPFWLYTPTDVEGMPRLQDGDGDTFLQIDIGAHEYDWLSADSDGDWVTDQNEVTIYGSSPTNANTDGDPHTDGEEVIADTILTNAQSYLQITAVSNHPPVTVYWWASSLREYKLQGCSNLLDEVWEDVPGAGPVMGIGGFTELQDTNEPSKGPNYRLDVRFP
ncbi:MAG: hypothetical protein HQ559_13185, partial [Lentisphaerae bacterium]|nr:hypothetical protein [Lentisphaerota bacterium]